MRSLDERNKRLEKKVDMLQKKHNGLEEEASRKDKAISELEF